MARVTDTNFLTIEGWMRSALDLSGNDLIVFAVIYQFSQGRAGRYIGGLPYLADWCGCHPDTARRALRNLESRGLITAIRGEVNGVPYCNYIVCEESLQNARVSPQNATDTLANCNGDPRKMQGKTITEIENNPNEAIYNSARPRFVKPTLEEVQAYCEERQNGIDPQAFIDYYTSNGWKVGNSPMKDWKAAVRTWENRRREPAGHRPQAPASRGGFKMSPEEYTLRALAKIQQEDGMLDTFGPVNTDEQ